MDQWGDDWRSAYAPNKRNKLSAKSCQLGLLVSKACKSPRSWQRVSSWVSLALKFHFTREYVSCYPIDLVRASESETIGGIDAILSIWGQHMFP